MLVAGLLPPCKRLRFGEICLLRVQVYFFICHMPLAVLMAHAGAWVHMFYFPGRALAACVACAAAARSLILPLGPSPLGRIYMVLSGETASLFANVQAVSFQSN
jgi:hypothetical protein